MLLLYCLLYTYLPDDALESYRLPGTLYIHDAQLSFVILLIVHVGKVLLLAAILLY